MKKLSLLALFLLLGFTPLAQATHYLEGTVSLSGEAFTGKNTYISLWCSGSNWSGCSSWVKVDSHGKYTLDGATDSYNCCSATYSGKAWDKCQIYAYQWERTDVANSEYSSVTFDCSTTSVKNIALRAKDKKVNVTVTSGGQATTGVSVSCYETSGSYSSSWIDDCKNGSCEVPVMAGTFTCNTYCRWTTWGSDCPYGGYPQKSVTLGANDTSASIALDFTPKNKKIHACVYAGDTLVTKDISVNCNTTGTGNYIGGNSSKADSDGCYTISAAAGTFYCSSSCNKWPCDEYKGNPNAYVTLAEADATKDVTLRYEVPDKKIRVTLMAGGTKITSKMTVSSYRQGGDWSYASASSPNSEGVYLLTVGTGAHNISAYTSDYQNSEVSGYPQGKCTFTSSDPAGTLCDVTLTFLKNDATIAAAVTDGSSYVTGGWLSANSHDVKSQSGSSGVGALVMQGLEAVNGVSLSTQVYASCSTSSSGACSVRLPAGTYSVCVWPPWDRQDLAQTCQEVTAAAGGLTAVNLVMLQKKAQINGTVTDSSGNGVKAYVNCWSYNSSTGQNDYMWRETDSSGYFVGNVVEGRTYNCTANPNTWNDPSTKYCGYTNEGQQSVTATASAQTVNFTVPSCDCSMNMRIVNADDETIPVNGSLECRPTTFRSGEYYYGVWGQMSSGTGILKVEKDRELKCKTWFWDSNYAGGDEPTCTCSDSSQSCTISVAPVIDDAICGGYVDGEGDPILLDNISYVSVHATKGNSYKSCEATSQGYCCDVSEGTWSLGYWIDPGSGFTSGSAGVTSSDVVVPASGGVDHDLTLLNTCSVAVSVLDLDSSGRPNVWLECCPYSASQEGANDYQRWYSCGWGESDSHGDATIKVGCPSGTTGVTYYCNAYIPYGMKSDENLNNPQECSADVVLGQVNTCLLQYEQPDATIQVAVTNGDLASADVSGLALTSGSVETAPPLKGVLNALETDASNPYANATVDCFSPAGGSFEVTADVDGNATCSCTSDDKWYVVCHNLVGNALYVSEATEVVCTSDTGVEPTTCELDFVTTVPEAQSVTIDDAATDQMAVTLSDGLEFSCDPGCLGDAGEKVTCTVAPAVTPFTANKVPVNFIAYSVSCFETVTTTDSEGGTSTSTKNAIQQLNKNATLKLPCNASQLENMGLTEDDVQCSYWDTATGSYKTITNCSINCEEKITISVDHLTDFVAVGNGYLGGIQGEDGGAVGKEEATEESGAAAAAAAACGGCYMIPADGKLDDRMIWVSILMLVGLSRLRYRGSRRPLDRQSRIEPPPQRTYRS